MDQYEENILRLNLKIRDLMTQIDTLETKNRKLQQENLLLVEDVANFRVQYALAEERRLQCKLVLEKEVERSTEQYETHQLLRKRYNDLIKEYVAQNQKLKTYEQNDSVKQPRGGRKEHPVEIIGSLSDVTKSKPSVEEKVSILENRCATLEKKLSKAYAQIDDLEFELESIDHLEDTNQRLEVQIRELKAELAQQRLNVPPLPSSSVNLASPPPPYGDTMYGSYTFASIAATRQNSQQDESKDSNASPEARLDDVSDHSNNLRVETELEPYCDNIIQPTSNTPGDK